MESEATIPLDRWLRHLRRHVKVAASTRNMESVHQIRVATRRLDTWLVLGGWRIYRDDLRWLRRKASAVRDLDVIMLRRPLPKPFRAWLVKQHPIVEREMKDALSHNRVASMLTGLTLLPPLARDKAETRLSDIQTRSMGRGKLLESIDAKIEDFHSLRRSLRRLRYGLEWTDHKTRALRQLQDDFGVTNDAAVLVRYWNSAIPPDKSSRFAMSLHADLKQRMAKARESWVRHRHKVAEII